MSHGEACTLRSCHAEGRRDIIRDAKWSELMWRDASVGDGGVTIVAGRGQMRRIAPAL